MEGRDGSYDDYGRKVWTDAPLLDLQMEEGGSDTRNVGILQELEMAKLNKTNRFSLRATKKEYSLVNTLF